MNLITLKNINYIIAGKTLLDNVDIAIASSTRVAIVGRNGAGKSSFIKLLSGELTADSGEIITVKGLSIAGLIQDVPDTANQDIFSFLVQPLGECGQLLIEYQTLQQQENWDALSHIQSKMDAHNAWDYLHQIENICSRLGVPTSGSMTGLSGGMKRRVLLAAALLIKPQILILDEPTNHLDLSAIEWLESYLKSYAGTVLFITHDRRFLASVATEILEIERGKIYHHPGNYETYLLRREQRYDEEEKHNALFDKKLAEEEAWIRTGIKARRTRNEGRVRALKALREAYKSRVNKQGQLTHIITDTSKQSGQIVFDVENLSFNLPNRELIKPLSLRLMRGDKLGILGPNGCGKTTLIKLLMGDLLPSSGTVKRGTNLEIAYFDQLRQSLEPNQTVMSNVADGSDFVSVNGHNKHVATYLKEFLFDPSCFQQKVHTLSGGEKNRLMLAKLLAKPVNCLVMDEPTNDLDLETLEILESFLVEYKGTVILISHDRAFLDEVVTSILVYEADGEFCEYVGGYEDYVRVTKNKVKSKPQATQQKVESKSNSVVSIKNKLTYHEKKTLDELPQKIEKLESKIADKHSAMMAPAFYEQAGDVINQFTIVLNQEESELNQLYQLWEELEAKR